jgi:radical SAM protein with 4Fe4S-binding SPASM domain
VLWPRLEGGRGPLAQGLSPQEIAALDDEDPERVLEWQKLLANAPGVARSNLVYHCSAGRHGFHIDGRGRLSPCIMARRPAFDLLQGSFRQGWDEVLGPASEEKRKLDAECAACRARSICSQCPGWSQRVHGDNEARVAFVCELGRLRAARFCPPEA